MAIVGQLTLSPLYWSIWFIAGIICTIVVGCIARSEYQKRSSEPNLFVSDRLKITSALSIVSGLSTSIGLCLASLPGTCFITYTARALPFGIQYLSVGLYQLSRLHYSFSKTSTRNAHGYPKWVFILMVTVGITVTVSWTMLWILGPPFSPKCGFRKDFSFEWHYKSKGILFGGNMDEQNEQFSQYSAVIIGIYSMWDITTLLLYSCKIKSLRNATKMSQDAVWRKFMFILQRIITLTLFYQISMILFLPIAVFVGFSSDNNNVLRETVLLIESALLTMFLSISMYLMMEHNTNEYLQFLRFFRRTGLKYVYFCCWHRVVDRQLADFEEMKTKISEEKPRHQKGISSTNFDNASKNVMYSNHEGRGISEPTIIVLSDCK